jgi:hypothetical protein
VGRMSETESAHEDVAKMRHNAVILNGINHSMHIQNDESRGF